MTFLLAGQDTSATLLSWALYFLCRNPEVAEKLKEEVDVVLGDELPTVESIKKLKYTKAVLEESLRLAPPVPMIDRVNQRDGILQSSVRNGISVEIAGYKIPKDTICCIFMAALHSAPQYWSNPHKFDPNRWLDKEVNKVNNWTFIPFIAGTRLGVLD